jgi:uncharacterized damage-inducible protein DinB
MNGRDAIRTALTQTQNMLNRYLEDLSDADLLVRPVPGANHIAWQLGHLISSEPHLANYAPFGAVYPDFPAGFDDHHKKAAAAMEPPHGYLTKAQYSELFNKTRQATINAVGKLTDADLDQKVEGDMAGFAPTRGALLLLISNHTFMHTGQFTVVRRKLGKPVLF